MDYQVSCTDWGKSLEAGQKVCGLEELCHGDSSFPCSVGHCDELMGGSLLTDHEGTTNCSPAVTDQRHCAFEGRTSTRYLCGETEHCLQQQYLIFKISATGQCFVDPLKNLCLSRNSRKLILTPILLSWAECLQSTSLDYK